VVAADDFEAIKPAPDIFLAAARMMGVAAADCVVVEDAPAGIQAAKAAGVCAIDTSTAQYQNWLACAQSSIAA
jgi:HAD superfamily hydrolase (TIGR01509 family)